MVPLFCALAGAQPIWAPGAALRGTWPGGETWQGEGPVGVGTWQGEGPGRGGDLAGVGLGTGRRGSGEP